MRRPRSPGGGGHCVGRSQWAAPPLKEPLMSSLQASVSPKASRARPLSVSKQTRGRALPRPQRPSPPAARSGHPPQLCTQPPPSSPACLPGGDRQALATCYAEAPAAAPSTSHGCACMPCAVCIHLSHVHVAVSAHQACCVHMSAVCVFAMMCTYVLCACVCVTMRDTHTSLGHPTGLWTGKGPGGGGLGLAGLPGGCAVSWDRGPEGSRRSAMVGPWQRTQSPGLLTPRAPRPALRQEGEGTARAQASDFWRPSRP